MDKTLKQNIISELTKRFNRTPTDNEVVNAQNDMMIRFAILENRVTAVEKKVSLFP